MSLSGLSQQLSSHINTIKLFVALFMITAGLYFMGTIAAGSLGPQDSIDDKVAQIKQQFNIEVLYKDSQQYIPLLWKIQPGSVSVSQISTENLQKLLSILPKELNKYPAKLLQENVSRIFALGELKFSNIPVGGAYLDTSIYIVVLDYEHKDYLKYLSGVFHHEFSSILMHHYKFEKQPWSMINPSDFSYATTKEEKINAIRKLRNIEGNKQLYERGFLTDYNQASIENDFNRYAEFAFTRPERLTELARKYPRIRRKVLLLKEFYLGISKNFKPIMKACCDV